MKRVVFTFLLITVLSYLRAQICQTLTVNSTSIACNGNSTGSATVTVSGGTAPYTYSWMPSGGTGSVASSMSAGVYTVRVTDAGTCVVTATVNILQPNFFITVSSHTNVICYGSTMGSASFTTIGGTPGYSYTWAPYGGSGANATGLSPGTFTLYVKDANNCAISETVTIGGPSFSLTATTTQTNNICGNVNGGATALATGGTPAYSYTWLPTGGNAATATLVSGVYTVNITDANNCATSRTVNITQSSQFTLTPTVSNITCNGAVNGSISVGVSGGTAPFTYTWNPPISNSPVITNLAPGIYTVYVTDAIGCTGAKTNTITQPLALATSSAQSVILCNGGTGGASVSVAGGTTPYTYTWTPTGGNASSASGLAAGNYTVGIRDANLCPISQTFAFSQPSAITGTTSQANSLCFGASTGSAGIVLAGGVPPYTYTWVPSGGNAATATSLAAGTYTVNFKDANNCLNSRTVSIGQPAAITGSIASSAANCNNADGSATVTASGGTGAFTYSWIPAGGNTPTATAINGGSYTCTVKDANNCQLNLVTFVPLINPSLFVTAANGTICSGFTTTLTATGSNSYTWSPSSSLSSANGSVVAASPTVSTVYTITGANLYGCTITNTIAVQIYAGPSPVLTINAPSFCAGNTASLTASGALSYTWNPATGLSNAFVSNPTTTLNTPFVYTVTGIDALGCTGSSTLAVTPFVLPVVTVSATTFSACLNQSVTLTASGASTYSWSNGFTINPLQVSPPASTVYTVIGTALNGCTDTTSVQVTMNPLPPVAISGNTVICSGIPAVLTVTGATTYNWSTGATAPTLTLAPTVNTSYTVSGTDANGCVTAVNFSLLVYQTPTVTIIGKREVCKNDKLILNVNGGSTYTWSTGEQASSITYTFTENAVLTVSSGIAGCTPGTASISVSVNPIPVISASANPTFINLGRNVQLTASGSTADYFWKPADGLSCSSCAAPVAKPSGTTIYTVESTNAKGCKGTATVQVDVDTSCGELFAPSAFSPNNDNNNDFWCVYGNCIEKLQCDIFNRWGQKVFSTSSKDQCWDGTVNGAMQDPGVFIYQIKTTLINGETKSLTGNFTLVR